MLELHVRRIFQYLFVSWFVKSCGWPQLKSCRSSRQTGSLVWGFGWPVKLRFHLKLSEGETSRWEREPRLVRRRGRRLLNKKEGYASTIKETNLDVNIHKTDRSRPPTQYEAFLISGTRIKRIIWIVIIHRRGDLLHAINSGTDKYHNQ